MFFKPLNLVSYCLNENSIYNGMKNMGLKFLKCNIWLENLNFGELDNINKYLMVVLKKHRYILLINNTHKKL